MGLLGTKNWQRNGLSNFTWILSHDKSVRKWCPWPSIHKLYWLSSCCVETCIYSSCSVWFVQFLQVISELKGARFETVKYVKINNVDHDHGLRTFLLKNSARFRFIMEGSKFPPPTEGYRVKSCYEIKIKNVISLILLYSSHICNLD